MNIQDLQGKKIGITILGGAMRATAYAGMLKALEELNLKPQAIIGSSGGAVVGASYAFSKTPEQILEHFINFNPYKLFNPFKIIYNRGIDYKPWEQHAAKLVSLDKNIEDADIALAIRAVDLDTEDSVYIETGSAVKAVVASSAFLQKYEYLGKRFIDGDYDPETGVEELKKLGAEVTILCFVRNKDESALAGLHITERNALNADIELHRPDLIVQLPMKDGNILNKQNILQYFEDGYKTTLEIFNTK